MWVGFSLGGGGGGELGSPPITQNNIKSESIGTVEGQTLVHEYRRDCERILEDVEIVPQSTQAKQIALCRIFPSLFDHGGAFVVSTHRRLHHAHKHPVVPRDNT